MNLEKKNVNLEKNSIDVSNKNILNAKSILTTYFVIFVLIVLFLFQTARWNHFNGSTKQKFKEVERKASIDDVKHPNPKKEYFRKVEIIKTIRAKSFPFVEIVKEENDKGIYSRDKSSCGCNN